MTGSDEPYYCQATLQHAHGTAVCMLCFGHDGKHEGSCDSCEESGDFTRLTWTEQDERWPI